MSRRRRIGVPIEIHAEEVYTRGMHEKFYNELYGAGAFAILEKSDSNELFKVVHTNEIGREDARVYKVWFTGIDKISCSCGLYEHAGLPCRHSLKAIHLSLNNRCFTTVLCSGL